MLTWSKPDAIVPDQPLRWILTNLRFYAIVAGVGIGLAFAVISIQAQAHRVFHPIGIVNPIGTGQIDRIKGGGATMVILIAMIILFGAAMYFTGRLYGTKGFVVFGIWFVVVYFTLEVLGGLGILG